MSDCIDREEMEAFIDELRKEFDKVLDRLDKLEGRRNGARTDIRLKPRSIK